MRYLVFGDVHGNLAALDAVLAAGRARQVDGYFFVGDVVGYGPNPIECIDRLHNLHSHGLLAWVAGNHELAVRGDVKMEGYSIEAISTLEWTRSLLAAQPWARHFIEAAETMLEVNDGIFLTHDSMVDPSSARYHRHANLALSELKTLAEKDGRLAFYGHTHSLRAELMEAGHLVLTPSEAYEGEGRDPHPVRLREGQVGWLGVGSVGFPTNKHRMPEYLIFDDDEWCVEKYALHYARQDAKQQTKSTLTPICGAAIAERIAHWL